MCLLPPWVWDVFVPRVRERLKSVNLKPVVIVCLPAHRARAALTSRQTYSTRCLPLIQLIDTFLLIPYATFVPLPAKDDESAPVRQ